MARRTLWIALLALLALLAPPTSLRAKQTAPAATASSVFLPLISNAPPALRSVRLVKDIATKPQAQDSNPWELTVADSLLYFVAEAGNHGRELWRYDGTRATQLTTFSPHQLSTRITSVNVVGTKLVFVVNDSELWSIDQVSLATTKLGSFTYFADPSTGVHEFTVMNGMLFFVGSSGIDDYQLWKTDGTLAGTNALTKLPNTGTTTPVHLTAGSGVLFFTADDTVRGRELWKSDGTVAGTLPLTDLAAGALSASIDALTLFNGVLYFVARVDGYALWRSDGTTGGTVRVASLDEPTTGGIRLAAGNNTLFLANPIFTQTLVLAYDGTTLHPAGHLDEGTSILRLLTVDDTLYMSVINAEYSLYSVTGTTTTTVGLSRSYYPPDYFTAFDHRLFFININEPSAENNGIWATDGTITGTVHVSEHIPILAPAALVPFDSALFFANDDPVTGVELWKTNGTPTGTGLALNINPDVASSNPSLGYPINVGLLFSAHTDDGNDTAMYSDGTASGTQPRAQLQPGGTNNDDYGPYRFGDALLFIADDGVHGRELWRTDQAMHNPQLLRDIYPGPNGSSIQTIGVIGPHFYFSADDGTTGQELWVTDGTPSSTKRLKDIRSGAVGSYPSYFEELGDTLLFTARESNHTLALWVTDGTEAHTQRLARFAVDDEDNNTILRWLGTRGGRVFFQVEGAPSTLWTTDGMVQGTQRISDVLILAAEDGPAVLDTNGTYFYFLGEKDGKAGLWRSDGTSRGTIFLLDVLEHPHNGFDVKGAYFGDKLILLFHDGKNGYQLWHTDGTPQSTKRLRDGVLARSEGEIGEFTFTDTLFMFVTRTPGTDLEKTLWRTDGTVAGTYAVLTTTAQTYDPVINNIHPVGNSLFFTAGNIGKPPSLWRSDGTVAGTQPILGVQPSNFSTDEEHEDLPQIGDTLYFVATDAAHGTELWRADGSTSAAHLVRDICAGPCSAMITNLTIVGNTVIFAANDGVHGNELWRSDGTTSGTALVDDIAPGADDADPGPFWVADGQVFFSAYRADVGRELWVLSAPGVTSTTTSAATRTAAEQHHVTHRHHVVRSS